MTRISQLLPPLRDGIPCPMRAAIGIALGLATALGITRAALWVVTLLTPVEVLEDLSLPLLLLTGLMFLGTLALMGSVIQRSRRLSHFFCWCADEPD